MKPIALIGAGGYVGSRIVERSVLTGELPIVPIVRSWGSQGRLARFGIETAKGDASKPESLIPSLKGCQMAVNLTMGDDTRIVPNVQAMYEACRVAEVPLFVHMSSAEVFGRADEPNLREDSLPQTRHWMKYGREKAAADAWLQSQFNGPVKVVILRPGLIWGPGSGWLVQPAQALVDGTAYLFNEGRGICNLIHVDNLIRHIELLARTGAEKSATYNMSDLETLTFWDYYVAIAKEIGIVEPSIQLLPDSALRQSALERALALTELAPGKAIKRRMPNYLKIIVKQELIDRFQPPIQEARPFTPEPSITKSAWWSQGTVRKLPTGEFAKAYPDIELQPFADSMRAAGRWLRYAGFVVSEAAVSLH